MVFLTVQLSKTEAKEPDFFPVEVKGRAALWSVVGVKVAGTASLPLSSVVQLPLEA